MDMHDEMESSERSRMSPPVAPVGEELSAPAESRWPSVIGGIAIALGIIALTCFAVSVGGMVIGTFFASEDAPAPPQPPPLVGVQQTAGMVLLIVLGIWHLVGGIGLIRRRAWSRSALVSWAVVKTLTTVASTVISVLYAEESVRFWNESMAAGSPDGNPPFQWTVSIYLALMYGLLAWFLIWPIFLLAWFSRSKIREEVERWREGAMV